MTKPVRLALLTAGLALFVWFIQRTGWEAIHQTFQTLGWLGLLALIPYTIVFSIDTLGWRFTFGPTALRQVSYWTTWRVRLIGEAINNVIPTLYVGGDAARVFLLKRQGVSKLTATSAAVRSKTAQSVAQLSFIALGALVTAVILPPVLWYGDFTDVLPSAPIFYEIKVAAESRGWRLQSAKKVCGSV